eukprot:jgi/Chrzof1/6514/UNPLg00862.t1
METDADSNLNVEEVPHIWAPPGLTASCPPHPPQGFMPGMAFDNGNYGSTGYNRGYNNNNRGYNPPTGQAVNSIPMFSDREGQEAHSWLQHFEQAADLYDWDDVLCLKIAKTRLEGVATTWSTSRRFDSWSDFKHQFLHRFGEKEEALLARLTQCTQGTNEPVKAFGDRFRLLAHRAGRAEDTALTYQFLKGLHKSLQQHIIPMRLRSMSEIIDYAIYLEEWMTNGIYEPPSSGVSFGPRNVGGGGDCLAVNRNSGGWTNDRQRSQNNNNYQNNQNYRRDQRDQRPDNRPPPRYNGFNNNTQRNGPGNYNNQAGNGPVG